MAKSKETSSTRTDSSRSILELGGLISEALALVPGTDVELSIMERYGREGFKERMLLVRDKLLAIRAHLEGVSI